MARLTGKLGAWELPYVHMWKDRTARIRVENRGVVAPDSTVATIGSCFAEEIALALARLGVRGAMHPGGLFYTTRSIRQEIERIFGGWPGHRTEPRWTVPGGFVHPFKDYARVFTSRDELERWGDDLDAQADTLFRSASVCVMTLGLVEAWWNPETGNYYRQIPHPAVFPDLEPTFHRLSVREMVEDLVAIRTVLRAHTRAALVLTVSPVPLHATVTAHDVRVANCESKSRIRAAVSEFVEAYPDVHYFPSYEIVTTAERASDFMREDGRHVERHAVDYIVAEFLRAFGAAGLTAAPADEGWLTPPAKTAATVRTPLRTRVRAALGRRLRRFRGRGPAAS